MVITIADGTTMVSKSVCHNLSWKMGDQIFKKNLRVLKLGSSDLILGIDWLKQFSPIMFDFTPLKLSFMKDGEEVSLQGGKEGILA